jgi:hypothetical protein
MKAEMIRDYTNKKMVDWLDSPAAKSVCWGIIGAAATYIAAFVWAWI